MARAKSPDRKLSFSTRIAPGTLDQLDQLVRLGRYPNRTAAIEAAVARLAHETDNALEQRRRAVEATRGALSLAMTSKSMREDEWEYLDWLGERLTRG